MSSVIAAPELISTAATDLANIGSTIGSANAAALLPTTGVLPAGADEVSAAIAALFGSHAQAYQALSAQAASFHNQFVQLMNAGAGQYAGAEAANASSMQPWDAMLNALGHIPPGQFKHDPFLPGTDIENPFFGVPPGHVMHTELIPGTDIENPLFGVPPGHWNISQLIQAIRMMMPVVPTG